MKRRYKSKRAVVYTFNGETSCANLREKKKKSKKAKKKQKGVDLNAVRQREPRKPQIILYTREKLPV